MCQKMKSESITVTPDPKQASILEIVNLKKQKPVSLSQSYLLPHPAISFTFYSYDIKS